MEYLPFVLAVSFVWGFIHLLISGLRRRNSSSPGLPPGPRPFPIIGNILQLGKLPHEAAAKLSKTYGPLMTLKLGSRTTIVISSPDLAKEALQKHDHVFSGRTVPDSAQVLDHHKFSIAWQPASAYWRNLRKVSATQIFVPKRIDSTQAIRRKKVQELVDYIEENCGNGQALDIGRAAFTTVLNSISNTFFSADLADFCSNASQEFQSLLLRIMEEAGRPNIADYFPALSLLDPQGARRRMLVYSTKWFGILDDIITKRVQLRASSRDCMASSDVLDSLLNHVEEDNSELSYDDIKHLLVDLFSAGIDTTASTVEWAMAELLYNPKKMAKARKELEEVLGNDGVVQESDISKLPYLQAIVKENFRLHPAAPFLVPHKAEADVEMCGFTVPKNAQILVNVWAMGRDSSIWPNPTLFSPERFLEKDGIDFKGRDFELIPFGAGRRMCPGLPLANRMVHLMLASLVHHFNWKLANEMKPENINMREIFGLSLHRAEPLWAIPIKLV
ncbi:cytochrome P450 76T24-like [Corylus avellana]|uniref:cytochrome P450 76T24-like n=1 Tax=Corylus avellana TaxID=13451 RepID=UPI00286B2481|nr:cytochrome P450 76T24-like [Corylus avellana]